MKVEEIVKRVAKDPYSENVIHGGLHPSSIVTILNEIFWSPHTPCDKVTLEISKEQDDHHISVRVLKKETNDNAT
mgnify:FL=1